MKVDSCHERHRWHPHCLVNPIPDSWSYRAGFEISVPALGEMKEIHLDPQKCIHEEFEITA